MTTFTPKETELLYACMEYMDADIIASIDFNKVAVKAGYKDAKNAKVMFMRLKKAKLTGGGDTTATASTHAPTKVTRKRKAGGNLTKPAAKRGRKAKAAKAAATEVDENVDDEEEGEKEEIDEEVTDESEEDGQEAEEDA